MAGQARGARKAGSLAFHYRGEKRKDGLATSRWKKEGAANLVRCAGKKENLFVAIAGEKKRRGRDPKLLLFTAMGGGGGRREGWQAHFGNRHAPSIQDGQRRGGKVWMISPRGGKKRSPGERSGKKKGGGGTNNILPPHSLPLPCTRRGRGKSIFSQKGKFTAISTRVPGREKKGEIGAPLKQLAFVKILDKGGGASSRPSSSNEEKKGMTITEVPAKGRRRKETSISAQMFSVYRKTLPPRRGEKGKRKTKILLLQRKPKKRDAALNQKENRPGDLANQECRKQPPPKKKKNPTRGRGRGGSPAPKKKIALGVRAGKMTGGCIFFP